MSELIETLENANATNQLRTEAALERSLRELADLKFALDESAIVAVTDQRGIINYVNQKFCEISKYSRQELLGQDHRIINSSYHSKEFISELWTTISQGNVWHGELRNRAKDGSVYWVDTTIVPFLNPEGKPYQYVAIRYDITERKRAEEHIREQAALLDHAQDAIMVRDLEDKIVYWNRSAQRIYGWSNDEVIGQNVRELLFKEARAQFEEAKRTALVNGEWIGELKQLTKLGDEIIVESRWTLVHDAAGNPKSILDINTDITERKKLEAQFLRAQRLESIGTLAGGIAHDLNNILSPIMMAVEILQLKFNDEETRQWLAILHSNAERGGNMVKQVLSFARGVEGERVSIQPKHVVRDIIKILKETLPKSIDIKFNLPDNLWIVSADATQLHQVMMNLCVNARDAMPHGGSLTIKAENTVLDKNYARLHLDAKAGKFVMISVADTGQGMSPDVLSRIFEPFYTTKDIGKGTGLGLSTALTIVKSHGGFLNVYSEKGEGTQFFVYVPAIEIGEMTSTDRRRPELPVGRGECILVVDDEESIRVITKGTLETFGYKVLTANDGVVAVELFESHQNEIDVVLTDMMMPLMDGAATIDALEKINPNVKIIAASGLATNGKTPRGVNSKRRVFLEKPYTAEKLLTTLALVLGHGRSD